MAQAAPQNLAEALRSAYPELKAIREAAGPERVFLVGGAVRDLLLGHGRSDIDLVVIGDAAALAARLGAETIEHERFATAKVSVDGHEVDIATAREEAYRQPGALPEVAPAATIEADLRRRDFTVNAMALPLRSEPRLIDPHGGLTDLEAGLLRVLHRGSFADDPTRAVRAARYAARFGFALEAGTAELLAEADFTTVSADRREAELLRLAAEPSAARGFELLAEWGLVTPRQDGIELASRVARLLSTEPWRDAAPRDRTLLRAALGPAAGEMELAAARPRRPSEGVRLARAHGPVELVLARALGAEWLDRYVEAWDTIRLEIDGSDLIAAGVSEGPALGRGLAEALHRKLDGDIDGREQELEVALAAAREPGE